MRTANCRQCGEEFSTSHPQKVFCDRRCVSRWHEERRDQVGKNEVRRRRYVKRIGNRQVTDCMECQSPFTYEIKAGVNPSLCSDECKLRRRRRVELKKYGITPERYEEMWELQDGRCPICSNPLLSRSRDQYAAVDHCHKTGQVRSLLCHRCNLAIGQFNDDPRLLIKALSYLGCSIQGPIAWFSPDSGDTPYITLSQES